MAEQRSLDGTEGQIAYRVWPHDDPARVVILAHGYGEHVGRYEHVAAALGARGAVVRRRARPRRPRPVRGRARAGGRLRGRDRRPARGRGGGPRASTRACRWWLVGHSMGGLIAARYAQRHGDGLAGLVLTGPCRRLGAAGGTCWRWTRSRTCRWTPTPSRATRRSARPTRPTSSSGTGRSSGRRWSRWSRRWRRSAMRRALGDLPALWIHGEDDQLVPVGPSGEGVARPRRDAACAR